MCKYPLQRYLVRAARSVSTIRRRSSPAKKNGEACFTEIMGSVKQKYLESPAAPKVVNFSDKALALSSQETEIEDADLGLLACWTPAGLARFANNYTEAEQYHQLDIMVFNSYYSPIYDCSEAMCGGPTYYSTTRISVTPESEAFDKRQHDLFSAQQRAMYASEISKGSSPMDIYKKIGKLILSQPDGFADKFGLTVKFRERLDAMSQLEAYGNSPEGRSHSLSPKFDHAGEPKIEKKLMQMKAGLSRNALLQKADHLKQDRQYVLMNLLYGMGNPMMKPASGHRA